MDAQLTAVIIDDEPKARRILNALLLEHCPNVQVTALADDVPSGVKAIIKNEPDVVFLDIEMPGYTGFQLLEFFENPTFEIVFTTAYSEYALQAFQVSAIDYLLKPIQIEQLEKAVKKVGKKQQQSNRTDRMEALRANLQDEGTIKKIALPVSDGLLFVETEDIRYLKADGSYTHFFLSDNSTLLVSKKLKEFESLLSNPRFFRPHRSYIINLDRVEKYVRQDGGYIVMENGDDVGLSREKKELFLEHVGG